MKDLFLNHYQKLRVMLSVFACVVLFSASSTAQTVNCQSTLPFTNYNVYQQGNRAKAGGILYEAKWYVQNQAPTSDPNGPWLVLGTCSDNTTVQDNCSALTNWSTATVYTGGELVVYNGNIFKARSYTQGQTPGSISTPWDLHGICDPNTLPSSGGGGSSSTTPWTIGGNSNATATSFIGTTNNFPILFKANNIESMRIATTGAVGVNVSATNGPNNNIYYHKFTVNGPTNLVGNENALSISSPTLSPNGTRHYTYFSNLTFPNSTIQYTNIGAYEFLEPSGSLQGGKHMVLQAANNANLGIGYSSSPPNTKLSVNGSTYINGVTQIGSQRVLTGHLDYKLSVDGKIICQKIVATPSNWADSVFSESYDLMSLPDLESYINQNQHLPEIPSESEVLDQGVELTKMNTLLLKKVEELTLYVIELQKRISIIEKK